MLSMFSAVSGHFTKGLVLGTLLPVLLFVAAAVPTWLLFTGGAGTLAAGSVAFMTDHAAALGVFVVAATGALYNLNTPIIRFYECYPWSRTAYGRRRTDRHKRRLAQAVGLQKALIAVRAGATDARLKAVVQRSLNDASRVIAAEYPGEALVLPTRLGNVIRNAEEYPRHFLSLVLDEVHRAEWRIWQRPPLVLVNRNRRKKDTHIHRNAATRAGRPRALGNAEDTHEGRAEADLVAELIPRPVHVDLRAQGFGEAARNRHGFSTRTD